MKKLLFVLVASAATASVHAQAIDLFTGTPAVHIDIFVGGTTSGPTSMLAPAIPSLRLIRMDASFINTSGVGLNAHSLHTDLDIVRGLPGPPLGRAYSGLWYSSSIYKQGRISLLYRFKKETSLKQDRRLRIDVWMNGQQKGFAGATFAGTRCSAQIITASALFTSAPKPLPVFTPYADPLFTPKPLMFMFATDFPGLTPSALGSVTGVRFNFTCGEAADFGLKDILATP